MATIVVYGGGFQPFHIGHLSSYLQAKKAFPDATFYVAASNDVKQRPIPFKDKQFLAQQAGVVDPFVETKNPINPQEILAQYDPEKDVYIMVRSERDPVGYTRKDGTPAYYQPYVKGQPMAPFSQHGYVFVTKKQNFTVDGEEVFSGSQVRSMYGSADDAGRMKIIQQLYPKSKQQQMIKSLLDKYLASPQEPAAMPVKPNAISKLKNKQLAEQIRKIRPLLKEATPAIKLKFMKLMRTAISESKETDYNDPSWDEKVSRVGQQAKQAQVLKSKGKEPRTRWNPVTKKYYVDFSDTDDKGVAEGLVKDIKRLATGKDVKSRAGQEIAKSQDASMKGDTKTSKKHFDRYDKLDKLANKEQGVAEGAPIVIAQAPIDVRNPKKVAQPVRYQGDIVPPSQPPSTEKRGVKGRPGQRPMPTYESASLSVEQLAHISDKALDDAYHYGRSTPGANFGWMANLQSAKAAKRLIDAGETDIEAISDAIHKGWNVTAAADYKGQLQLDTPTPEDKKLKRAKLAQQSYSQLPEEEKEKDRVVARAMLAALGKTNVSESTDYLEEK